MEVMFAFSVFLLLLEICSAALPVFERDLRNKNYTDGYLSPLQLIRKYGYPAEAHTIKTTDGYLLELHRIKHGMHKNDDKLNSSISNKYPVFLTHGIFGSSGDFFICDPKQALPFLLADLGFDVWLLNARGNAYSKAHESIVPDDTKFWDFSFHESGVYDVPNGIDFILEHTKKDQVILLGYSLGTTLYFVMASMLPEYNEKIKLSINMAPCVFFRNIRSPVFLSLSKIAEIAMPINKLFFKGELLPKSDSFVLVRKLFFETNKPGTEVYKAALSSAFGYDPEQFDDRVLDSVIARYPLGFSMKAATHYAQLIKSGKFQQYDYGFFRNLKRYGSSKVPEYNLKNVTAPTYIYAGKNDILATVKDAEILANVTPAIKIFRIVDYPLFAHLDFILSKNVKNLIYDTVIDDLMNFLKANS